ncbi:hypothetical protein VTO58DRAFT_101051 [Aureobasidium pullulans]
MGQAFSLCRGARQQSPHSPNTPTTPTDTTVRYSYPQEIGGQQAGYVDQELLRSHLDFTFPLDQFPINRPSGDRFQIRCVNDLYSFWVPEAMSPREYRAMLKAIKR